jgi:hypothetical protein
MKKAFIFGIAAFFALAVFSCNIPQDEITTSNVVGYTDDGRAIVDLELGVGLSDNSRALHKVLAKAAADFYEVIFFDGTDIYRTSWREGRTARLKLPAATYSGATNYAYIFAGRYEDMMLLGVGTIANHYEAGAPGTAVPGAVIGTNTVKVDFTVTALETDVNATQTGVGASTFQPGTWSVQTIKVNDMNIPVFMFPANNTGDDTATFNITCATAGLLGQIVYSGDAPKYVTKPYAWPDSRDDLPIDLASVNFPTDVTSTYTANDPVDFPIKLEIVTNPDDVVTGKGGLCLFGIEIPVLLKTNAPAANGSAAAAKTWYLKGGLNNILLDMGKAQTGMGGAILIGSGNVLNGNGVEVSVGGWTP